MKEVREALPVIESLDYALAVVMAWKEMMKVVKDFDRKSNIQVNMLLEGKIREPNLLMAWDSVEITGDRLKAIETFLKLQPITNALKEKARSMKESDVGSPFSYIHAKKRMFESAFSEEIAKGLWSEKEILDIVINGLSEVTRKELGVIYKAESFVKLQEDILTITAYRVSQKQVVVEEKVNLVREEEIVNAVTSSVKEMWKEEKSRGNWRGKNRGRGRSRNDEKDYGKKESVCFRCHKKGILR